MTNERGELPITPETKIGALLNAYPQIEEQLLGMAPAFSKLKNPVLRRTVAKVANLRQAADLAGLPLGELINNLRKAVGQQKWESDETVPVTRKDTMPDWITSGQIIDTVDARPLLDAGEHPAGLVMQQLTGLKAGEVLELITPFRPSPLIDMARGKGYRALSREEADNLFRTYFSPE